MSCSCSCGPSGSTPPRRTPGHRLAARGAAGAPPAGAPPAARRPPARRPPAPDRNARTRARARWLGAAAPAQTFGGARPPSARSAVAAAMRTERGWRARLRPRAAASARRRRRARGRRARGARVEAAREARERVGPQSALASSSPRARARAPWRARATWRAPRAARARSSRRARAELAARRAQRAAARPRGRRRGRGTRPASRRARLHLVLRVRARDRVAHHHDEPRRGRQLGREPRARALVGDVEGRRLARDRAARAQLGGRHRREAAVVPERAALGVLVEVVELLRVGRPHVRVAHEVAHQRGRPRLLRADHDERREAAPRRRGVVERRAGGRRRAVGRRRAAAPLRPAGRRGRKGAHVAPSSTGRPSAVQLSGSPVSCARRCFARAATAAAAAVAIATAYRCGRSHRREGERIRSFKVL